MKTIECKTQAELDAALALDAEGKDVLIRCIGGTWSNRLIVKAAAKRRVEARENSNVEARENSNVQARGNSNVEASSYVSVHHLSKSAKVKGGVIIVPPDLSDAKNWVEFYGLKPVRGIVTLFKAVNDEWLSGYGQSYEPGTKPECADWKPKAVCGNGFHFSPHPQMAKPYNPSATRFVACPVRVSELVPIVDEWNGTADKCKAPRIAKPTYEVDAKGNPIAKEAA